MKIDYTNIDVYNGTLTMEFDEKSIHFNIFEVIRYLNNINTYYYIDVIDSCVEHVFDLKLKDTLPAALMHNLDSKNLKRLTSTIELSTNLKIKWHSCNLFPKLHEGTIWALYFTN